MAPKRNSLQQASLSLLLSLLSPRMQPPFLLLPTHRSSPQWRRRRDNHGMVDNVARYMLVARGY